MYESLHIHTHTYECFRLHSCETPEDETHHEGDGVAKEEVTSKFSL